MLQQTNGEATKKQIIRHLCAALMLDGTAAKYAAELNAIAAQCSIETFNPGSVLMLENDRSHCMYIILSGRVNILKGYATSNEVIIATRGVDEVIGEMGIDNVSPRFASVVALETVETVVIPYESLNNSEVKWRFVWIANNKLREAQERRYAELVHYQKQLGGLDSLQEAFLGVVRHEMMTPVAKAIMALGLLKDRSSATMDSREVGDLLNIVEVGLYDIQRLVETMLDYVNAHEQGNQGYYRTGFYTLVDTAVERMQSFAHVKRITIETFLGETLWVQGDSASLVRAAEHMIHNAVKAASNGGTVQVCAWEQDGKAWFSVRDEGVGIPLEFLDKVWIAFNQNVDVLMRGVEKGLGLGLAITKKIIENHHGDVFVESTEGKGSVFGFWLPVAEAQRRSVEGASA